MENLQEALDRIKHLAGVNPPINEEDYHVEHTARMLRVHAKELMNRSTSEQDDMTAAYMISGANLIDKLANIDTTN